MLSYKTYVQIISSILLSIVIGSFIYIYFNSKSYPIPLFHRISLDAKMKFIRDMEKKNDIDTIIIGSSIGLNNIQGKVLENSSKKIKHVLNLSALGLTTTQVAQLTPLFSLFPNVKRVIYSSQFEDVSGTPLFNKNEVQFAKGYIKLGKNNLNYTYSIYTFKHLIEFAKNHWKWEKEYANNKTNHGLAFDHTGSVPLDMYGNNINHAMFSKPPKGTGTKLIYQENFIALGKMIQFFKSKNIHFYFIAQPYRQYMIDNYEDIRIARDKFIHVSKNITKKYNENFLDLHYVLNLGDEYFVDREHLNSNGSKLSSVTVAKLIDNAE